ncbi:MAG: flagellin FliC [Silvanigrellales bacterium]|nr:flagellin FliC [Silvanigrellales bacterium]
MGLRIKTNVQSIFAQRMLGISTSETALRNERLSSGYRINKAADDAAGLAIAENLRADVRSLGQAKRNAADGISLVQTAEGGLNEITNIVVRLRELSVQAASDTIGPTERGFLQQEFGSLKDEIDRIALASEFNGTHLLTGMNPLPDVMMKNHNMPPLEVQVGKNWFAETDGLDVPNPVDIIRIDLREFNAMTEGEGSLGLGSKDNFDGTRVDSKESAQQSMGTIDSALDRINGYRAKLGAIQNRFNSTVANLGIQIENLESAKSRIKDADMAEETSAMAKAQVLQQANVSVLMQANQLPNLALKLLG